MDISGNGRNNRFFLIFVFVLNFPFIIIQRYNRPRLVHLQKKLLERKERKKEKVCVC